MLINSKSEGSGESGWNRYRLKPWRWRNLMKVKVVLLLIAFLVLIDCQSHAAPAQTMSKTAAFRVALLLPRNKDADGWVRSGYQGLLLIEKKLGADIAYSENVPVADFEKVFRQYASEGYDFIIGHGNQFLPAAKVVAAEFPETAFALAGKYGGNNINLGALSLREGEMGYLFGVIAAIKSKTRHVGYLGGEDNVSQQEAIKLYKRGIAATDPSVKVTVDFVGSFTDTEKAHQIAQAQIDSGVDVIFLLAGAAGLKVYAQAEQAGIYTLGWMEDLNHLAPKSVLTSNVQEISQMLLQGAILAKQGRWEGKQYKFGMAEGMQRLAPFYGLITAEQKSRVDAVVNELIKGTINISP